MITPETIREKLRKIAMLAQSGVAGEMDNAQRQLDLLCRKYDVDPQTLLTDDPKPRKIDYKTLQEGKLIAQIAYAHGIAEVFANKLNQVLFDATEADYLDILTAVSVYLPAFRKQLDELKKQVKCFESIFICKNRIYDPKKKGEDHKLTAREIERLKVIESGLHNAQFVHVRKQLEA